MTLEIIWQQKLSKERYFTTNHNRSAMKKLKTILLILLTATFVQGQNYEQIDNYVRALEFKSNVDLAEMAEEITAKSNTDEERLRAIFVWIAHNIEYDVKSFKSGKIPNSTAIGVVQKGRAVCEGYSNLFQELASNVGIKSLIVSGFSKGYGYQNRKKLETSDHAWNIVLLNNDWYLIDATWGAGHLNMRGRYVPAMQEKYFMADPAFFVTEHLPEDPAMQLLPCPIKPKEFLQDSSKVLKIARSKEKCYSYRDTLAAYIQLDTVQQKVASAERMYRYFNDNVYKPAILLNQAAYAYSKPLNDGSVELDKKLELAQKSLKYYKRAEEILSGAARPHERDLKRMVKQNIANVEKFIDFYKK